MHFMQFGASKTVQMNMFNSSKILMTRNLSDKVLSDEDFNQFPIISQLGQLGLKRLSLYNGN